MQKLFENWRSYLNEDQRESAPKQGYMITGPFEMYFPNGGSRSFFIVKQGALSHAVYSSTGTGGKAGKGNFVEFGGVIEIARVAGRMYVSQKKLLLWTGQHNRNNISWKIFPWVVKRPSHLGGKKPWVAPRHVLRMMKLETEKEYRYASLRGTKEINKFLLSHGAFKVDWYKTGWETSKPGTGNLLDSFTGLEGDFPGHGDEVLKLKYGETSDDPRSRAKLEMYREEVFRALVKNGEEGEEEYTDISDIFNMDTKELSKFISKYLKEIQEDLANLIAPYMKMVFEWLPPPLDTIAKLVASKEREIIRAVVNYLTEPENIELFLRFLRILKEDSEDIVGQALADIIKTIFNQEITGKEADEESAWELARQDENKKPISKILISIKKSTI